MNIETEIKFPIQLCKKNGDLNPDSIGWSRQPMHRCNLSRKWLRKKRWNYWAVYDDEFLVSFTISDIDYAGVIFCYFWDRKTNTFDEATLITPFGFGCRMGQMVNDDAVFESKSGRSGRLHFSRTEEGYHLEVFFNRKNAAPIQASIDVVVPMNWESLNVVIPFSPCGFQPRHHRLGRASVAGSLLRHHKSRPYRIRNRRCWRMGRRPRRTLVKVYRIK